MADEDLDPREVERSRRRDRAADAERRALMKPGMGKVFKQILDAQAKAARAELRAAGTPRPKPSRRTGRPPGSGASRP